MAKPKAIEVNGTIYLRRATAGQMRDNARKMQEATRKVIDAQAVVNAARSGDPAEKAQAEAALDEANDRAWQAVVDMVAEAVVGVQDEDGNQHAFEGSVEEEIDGSDMQELALHLCGETRDAVRVIGTTPFSG